MAATKHTKPVVLIVDEGDGIGDSVARAFAAEGYTICAARRDTSKLEPLVQEITRAGGAALAFCVDSRDETVVTALVQEIEANMGPIEVAVFNDYIFPEGSILETTASTYRDGWESCCFSGFLVGREVARRMEKRGSGTILFTGFTASLRGGAGFAAASGGKTALRSLAQSMARELSPKGIHVAHIVIDGMVNSARKRAFLGARGDELAAAGGLMNADDIATNYLHVHKQGRSAWTHELDLRTFVEKW